MFFPSNLNSRTKVSFFVPIAVETYGECTKTEVLAKIYLSKRQEIPGRSLPSRNSSDAPPPVEM